MEKIDCGGSYRAGLEVACCHDREASKKKENRRANAIKGLPSRVTWGKFPHVYFAGI